MGQIVDKWITPHGTEYNVRWKGFTKRYDQWINKEDINAPELIHKYKWNKSYNNIYSKENNSKINTEHN